MLLQLHLHSQLNTWLQWIGQKQQQAETRNIYIWGMDASYIRYMMVESFSYNVAPMHIWNPNVPNTVGADVAPRAKTRTMSEDPQTHRSVRHVNNWLNTHRDGDCQWFTVVLWSRMKRLMNKNNTCIFYHKTYIKWSNSFVGHFPTLCELWALHYLILSQQSYKITKIFTSNDPSLKNNVWVFVS